MDQAQESRQADQQTSAPRLARSEWDFSRVPKAQLEVCFAWEYAREWAGMTEGYAVEIVPTQTVSVAVSEDEWEEQPNPEYEQFESDADNWIGCLQAGSLMDYSERLGTPWMDLPIGIRTKIFQNATPEAIGLIELAPGNFEFNAAFGLDKRFGKAWFKAAAFRINWDQSDKRLLSDFAAWLKENRQKPAKEQRGRDRRGDLNMLGAMRLLHHMPLEDAIIETTRALGEPLYGKRPSWERARKGALRVFQEDFLIDAARWGEEQIPSSYPKFDAREAGKAEEPVAKRVLETFGKVGQRKIFQ